MINQEFIEKWAPKYTYSAKYNYSEILGAVKEELNDINVVSEETFKKIIIWKAERNINNINWNQFEIYEEAIKDVLKFEGFKKVCRLDGLPGILLPNATTILHFMYPDDFPIVDVRTVRVLLYCTHQIDGKLIHYLDPRYKGEYYRYRLWGYYNFRKIIMEISRVTEKNLRDIDKALFSYDTEQILEEKFKNGFLTI